MEKIMYKTKVFDNIKTSEIEEKFNEWLISDEMKNDFSYSYNVESINSIKLNDTFISLIILYRITDLTGYGTKF